jgi:hypothetical protein
LKYRQLMAGFNTLGAFAEAFKITPPPAVPRPPNVSLYLKLIAVWIISDYFTNCRIRQR